MASVTAQITKDGRKIRCQTDGTGRLPNSALPHAIVGKKWWQVRDFPSFSHIYRFLAENLKQAAPVSFKEMGAACFRLPFRLFLQPDCVLSAAFCVSSAFAFLLPDLADHEPQAVLRLGVVACFLGEADAARPVEAQEVVAGAAVGDADAPALEGFAAIFSVVGVLHAPHVKVGAEDEVRHICTVGQLNAAQIAVVARGFALRVGAYAVRSAEVDFFRAVEVRSGLLRLRLEADVPAVADLVAQVEVQHGFREAAFRTRTLHLPTRPVRVRTEMSAVAREVVAP